MGRANYRIFRVGSFTKGRSSLVDHLYHLSQIGLHRAERLVQSLGQGIRLFSFLIGRLHALGGSKLRLEEVGDLALVIVQSDAELFLFVLELLEDGIHSRLRLFSLLRIGVEIEYLFAVGDKDLVERLNLTGLGHKLHLVILKVRSPAVDDLVHGLVLQARRRRWPGGFQTTGCVRGST